MKTHLGLVLSLFLFAAGAAKAQGPFSSFDGVTPGAPDNPIARADISQFESTVVDYAPAPGVGPSFGDPTSGLATLGDLYSPLNAPTTNVPFDKTFAPATGVEPSPAHAGLAVDDPFSGDVNSTTDTYGFLGIDAPGSITVGFDRAITNGPGPDFAVFENGFGFGGPTSLFAELAFVEVSSNGVDFARFPSISLNTAATATAGSFQGYDATNLFNLAGKHAANWGTPFDLAELAADPLVTGGLLDLASIEYVRLVDVVGSGEITDGTTTVVGATDSLGNPILDNWVTFDSAGFDYVGLSTGAVGVLNAVPEPGMSSLVLLGVATVAGVCRSKRA